TDAHQYRLPKLPRQSRRLALPCAVVQFAQPLPVRHICGQVMACYRACVARCTILLIIVVGCWAAPTGEESPSAVSSLTISPRSMVVSIGTPRRFAVQLGDSMGNPVGRRVAWHSRYTVVARGDTGGLVSGLATGNAVVVATSERRDDSAVVAPFARGHNHGV